MLQNDRCQDKNHLVFVILGYATGGNDLALEFTFLVCRLFGCVTCSRVFGLRATTKDDATGIHESRLDTKNYIGIRDLRKMPPKHTQAKDIL